MNTAGRVSVQAGGGGQSTAVTQAPAGLGLFGARLAVSTGGAAAGQLQGWPVAPGMSHLARLEDRLTINSCAQGRMPQEGLVPAPVGGVSLRRDSWLCENCQAPKSAEMFQELVDSRRRREERREEFVLEPLVITLENMRRFIGHIRAGRQYPGALTAQEERAMAMADEKAVALLQARAPYQRTVALALAFVTLCEIVTDRLVLEPLRQRDPARFARHVRRKEDWSTRLGAQQPGGLGGNLSASALDPTQVMALGWGGNTPDGADETRQLFDAVSSLHLCYSLREALHNREMLIYPSFEVPGVRDLCRLRHLPLHVVGMTTAYAHNADGTLMSPLAFAEHDLGDMANQQAVGTSGYRNLSVEEFVLRVPDQRLVWRRMLLDQLPQVLRSLHLEAPLTLLLFQLFHKETPDNAAAFLDAGKASFFHCLCLLARARREERGGYSATWQTIGDTEAALAARWAVRLWSVWKAADYRPLQVDRLRELARAFVNQDVPRLQRHLNFIARHRSVLRQFFGRWCHLDENSAGFRSFTFSPEFADMWHPPLFEDYHPRSGLTNLDNTDLAYFMALRSTRFRREVTAATGNPPPPGEEFGPDPGA